MTADFYNFQRRAVAVLRRHPEALANWVAEFRTDPPKLIAAGADAA
jgi:hypothetical protein